MRERIFENLLFCAIEQNAPTEMLEWLLEERIDLYATNQDNRTPLMLAARIKPQERAIEICKLLIDFGVLYYNDKAQICTFRQEDNRYISSIEEAQEVGNEQAAMFLLGQIFNN